METRLISAAYFYLIPFITVELFIFFLINHADDYQTAMVNEERNIIVIT